MAGMPIIIENISQEPRKGAVDMYRVRVNDEEIATFGHYPGDGLATCLQLAADAVRLARPARRAAKE